MTQELIKVFYLENIPGAEVKGNVLMAPCPFCSSGDSKSSGKIVVDMNPKSFFFGYFRCMNQCRPGGFHVYFGKLMRIDEERIPDFNPDRDPHVHDVLYPNKNLNTEIKKFMSFMNKDLFEHFKAFGVSEAVIKNMKIGYNGRYLVYPYTLQNGNSYAARCISPQRSEDFFWHGDKKFFNKEFLIYNVQEIERCEEGAIFITDSEDNLMTLLELGYPGIAVPAVADLEDISLEQLANLKHIFLAVSHSPEARISARSLAAKLGYKARLIHWPSQIKQGHGLSDLAKEKGSDFKKIVQTFIQTSKAYSPFSSPENEHRSLVELLEREKGKELLGFSTGFEKMDNALEGLRGINILGGPPKAGKSCFFMQISTEMARKKTPVIYYDFENGRRKIYMRTLCRLSRLSEKSIRMQQLRGDEVERFKSAYTNYKEMLYYFRVITDRKLSPDIMRRQIDYFQHETRNDSTLVVIDSLHKLPFKDLTERRTGIDEWLRNLEAIRDEQNVSFLVISELSRGESGSYSDKPDLGSFKESGDIEYSADNAMILLPDWSLLDPISTEERNSTLWMVASRENSPGIIATYELEFPFWGFKEK